MNPQSNYATLSAKRLLLFFLIGIGSIFLIRGIYALGQQSAESTEHERKLKTRDFRGMPVAMVEVRNLQSKTWYDDLEIELKNVSSKPIYFLTAYLEFPDDSVAGTVYGVRLAWGNSKNLDNRRYAQPEAEYVSPGKTLILTIPEKYKKGLNAMHRLRPHVTKNLRLWFEKTYFGDGTGFESEGRWRDFRGNGPPPNLEKKHHPNRAKEKRSHTSTSTPEPICGGGNCFRWVIPQEPGPSSCSGCETINAYSSPEAPCSVLRHDRFDCDGDGLAECYDEIIDEALTQSSCTGPTPTPTPTPSPSPSPSPSPLPTPTPCPAETFDPDNNGNCPLYSNKFNGCCVCFERNPQCNGAIGSNCFWVESFCACYNLDGLCPTYGIEGYGGAAYCEIDVPASCTDWVDNDGDLDIDANDSGCICPSPIVIDTLGNGFALTSASDGVFFDISGHGRPLRLAWIQGDDAWLALDRNGNGTIDNGRELFGNYTPQTASPRPNGFLALTEFDQLTNGGNADGRIDIRDAVFSSLRLWLDTNRNGVSNSGELRTLSSLDVTAIDLDFRRSHKMDDHGNMFRYRAKVYDSRRKSGRWAWDVFLVSSP